MNTKNAQRGFTLIELIIALVICSLIGIVIFDFFINNDSLIRSEYASLEVIGGARDVITEARTLTAEAIEIIDTRSFWGNSYTTGSSTLILRLPSITSAGDIVSGQSDYAVIYATGTSAYRITEPSASSARASTTRFISNNIYSLIFSFSASTTMTNSPYVDIEVESQKEYKKNTAQTQLRERMNLRNKDD